MKINIDKGFLEYSTNGIGTPLLFIHGFPLSRKIWEPQLTGLSDVARMVSLDLRGHGESFPFEGSYPMDLLAEDCKKLLDHTSQNSPLVVCGLSMGGYITMALCRLYPGIFKGMIIISTRSGPDSTEGKTNRDVTIKNANDYGAGLVADRMVNRMFSPNTISKNLSLVKTIHGIMSNTSVQGIVGASEGMRDRTDSTPIFSQIDCPLLVIHGEDDQLISIQEAELMHQNARNSSIAKISKAGHLVNLEQPDLTNQAIRDFLSDLN